MDGYPFGAPTPTAITPPPAALYYGGYPATLASFAPTGSSRAAVEDFFSDPSAFCSTTNGATGTWEDDDALVSPAFGPSPSSSADEEESPLSSYFNSPDPSPTEEKGPSPVFELEVVKTEKIEPPSTPFRVHLPGPQALLGQADVISRTPNAKILKDFPAFITSPTVTVAANNNNNNNTTPTTTITTTTTTSSTTIDPVVVQIKPQGGIILGPACKHIITLPARTTSSSSLSSSSSSSSSAATAASHHHHHRNPLVDEDYCPEIPASGMLLPSAAPQLPTTATVVLPAAAATTTTASAGPENYEDEDMPAPAEEEDEDDDDDDDAPSSSSRFRKGHKVSASRLPPRSVKILKNWLLDRLNQPYPTKEEKAELALATGLGVIQVNNWFINARRRVVRPMLAAKNASSAPASSVVQVVAPPVARKLHFH